jgi:hypothetical protein
MSSSTIPPTAQQQPPTAAERLAMRTILGSVPPSTRPSSAENVLVHLYSPDGLRLRLESEADIFLVVQDAGLRGDVRRIMADVNHHVEIRLPTTVHLSVAWCVGRRSTQQFPLNFQSAFIEQLARGPNILSAILPMASGVRPQAPEGDAVSKCRFVQNGAPGTSSYRIDVPLLLIRQTYVATIPIFARPKVLVALLKTSESTTGTGTLKQTWVTFAYCTACRAEGSISRCSHWHDQLTSGGTFTVTGADAVRRWEQAWSNATGAAVSEVLLEHDQIGDQPAPASAHPGIVMLDVLSRAPSFLELP